MELLGISYLRGKLASKKNRVILRYKYYDQKYKVKNNGIAVPGKLDHIQTKLGWCTKAVDALADRLIFKGFESDGFEGDSLGMSEIFNMNNPDVLFDSAIKSALISSCSFIYISQDADGYPSLQVIDGGNATGIMDTKTGLLKEGYAILDTDDNGLPTIEAYFTPTYTEYYEKGRKPYQIANPTGYPLLVPIVYMPSDTRPFGHSRISRACMDIQQDACITMRNLMVASEFNSYPQKYIVGLSDEVETIDAWKASISSMLTIYKDSDGDKPTVGQFSQMSMTPYLDQMSTNVKLFCGETGLTSDDLGFVSENPSSAESIKAAHETLRLTAEKAQRSFGSGFLNVGFVACCLRDEFQYSRVYALNSVRPVWYPSFKPDASALSIIGDGAVKINQAVPGYFNKDNLEEMTGVGASKIEVNQYGSESNLGTDEEATQ